MIQEKQKIMAHWPIGQSIDQQTNRGVYREVTIPKIGAFLDRAGYAVEISLFQKTGGMRNERIFFYKCRKNVSSWPRDLIGPVGYLW